jgi:IS5 family transposase
MNPSALCLRNPDHLWPEQIQGEFSSTQPDLLWMEDRKERLRGSPFAALLTEEELANYGHRLEANGMNGSQRLFTHFEKNLTAQGIIGREGSIVDASFVAAPRQRNTREQNEKIKAGERPEGFEQSSAKGKQKDCDARWVVKNKEVHYGYKNHIKADAKTKLIINYSTTPANVHDS